MDDSKKDWQSLANQLDALLKSISLAHAGCACGVSSEINSYFMRDKCEECDGVGSVIRHAWDPDHYSWSSDCDYCNATGIKQESSW